VLDGDDEAEAQDATAGEKSNVVMQASESYLGVSTGMRAWAQELGTDPYTRN